MIHRWRQLLPIVFVVIVASWSGAAEFNPVTRQPAATVEVGATNHRLLIKLADSSTAGPTALAGRHHLKLLAARHLSSGLHALQVQPESSGESIPAMLTRLRADPSVQFVEIDQRRYAHAMPNDPNFSGQWYLQKASTTPSAVNAVDAWDATTGSNGLVIAELDTGVRFDHPDLLRAGFGGKLLPGYDFIADIPSANDTDGRDADASDPGDWITTTDTGTSQFKGCTTEDSSWHGTRVAGILGALGNNSTGIAGLNWNGWILPVRVMGKCGGYDSDIIAGMLWAAGIHVNGVPDNPFPARIINMSLGGSGACTNSYQLAVNQVVALGTLVVVSAGNEGGPVDAPGNCTGVAAVAGLRHIGTKVGFSSLGPEVTVSAPAGNCVNSASGQPCLYSIDTTVNLGTTTPGSNGYSDQFNTNLGTSFSSPIVAGIAGLMVSVNGNLASTQLIARLRESASPFPTTSSTTSLVCHVPTSSSDVQNKECICTNQTCGAGMVNAAGAVAAALRPIAAIRVPASVSAGQNVVLEGGGSSAACGRSVRSYAWSVVNPGGNPPGITGASTSTATVVAPPSGSFTMRLTITDDAGRQDTADVVVGATSATTTAPVSAGSNACLQNLTITPAGTVSVSVSPSSARVLTKGTQAFSATVTNTGILPVIWRVNGIIGGNATFGTISSSGVYTAPAVLPSPAIVTISATSTDASGTTGTAQVTLISPYVVTLSPATATVTTGGTNLLFTATINGAASNAVNWLVDGIAGGNATVGTISSTGVYTPPATVPSAGTVTVTAVAQGDVGSSASAQITVIAAAGGGSAKSGGGGAFDGLTLVMLLMISPLARTRRLRLAAVRQARSEN